MRMTKNQYFRNNTPYYPNNRRKGEFAANPTKDSYYAGAGFSNAPDAKDLPIPSSINRKKRNSISIHGPNFSTPSGFTITASYSSSSPGDGAILEKYQPKLSPSEQLKQLLKIPIATKD